MTTDQDPTKLREPEPFQPTHVKERAKAALTGDLRFSPHALQQMRKRNLESTDIVNVLRAGKPTQEPEGREYENWRYSMSTKKLKVVFCFDDDTLVVITAHPI